MYSPGPGVPDFAAISFLIALEKLPFNLVEEWVASVTLDS